MCADWLVGRDCGRASFPAVQELQHCSSIDRCFASAHSDFRDPRASVESSSSLEKRLSQAWGPVHFVKGDDLQGRGLPAGLSSIFLKKPDRLDRPGPDPAHLRINVWQSTKMMPVKRAASGNCTRSRTGLDRNCVRALQRVRDQQM